MLNFPSLADFYTSTVVMEEASSTTSTLYELGMALLIVSAVELFVEAAKMAHRVYLSEWVTGLAPWGTTFKHDGDSSIRARIAGFSLKDIGAALNEKIEADDEPAKKAAEARQHREERKKKAAESKQLRGPSIDRTPQQEQEKNQAVVVPGTSMDGAQNDNKKKGEERDVETGQQAPAAAGATSEYSAFEKLDHERNLVKHNMWWALPRVLCDIIAFALSEWALSDSCRHCC